MKLNDELFRIINNQCDDIQVKAHTLLTATNELRSKEALLELLNLLEAECVRQGVPTTRVSRRRLAKWFRGGRKGPLSDVIKR